MSLTLVAEQRLESVGLITFFGQDTEQWCILARETYNFLAARYPNGSTIRRDDVATFLKPLLEVNEAFSTFRDGKKLTQKYWITDFADLICDRLWDTLSGGDGNVEAGDSGT